MIIELIVKIALVALASSILCSLLSEVKKEYAVFVKICTVAIICSFVLTAASQKLTSLLDEIGALSGSDELIVILFKGAVICIAAKIAGDLCAESGNKVVADAVELAAGVMVVVLSYPLIISVLKAAVSFID